MHGADENLKRSKSSGSRGRTGAKACEAQRKRSAAFDASLRGAAALRALKRLEWAKVDPGWRIGVPPVAVSCDTAQCVSYRVSRRRQAPRPECPQRLCAPSSASSSPRSKMKHDASRSAKAWSRRQRMHNLCCQTLVARFAGCQCRDRDVTATHARRPGMSAVSCLSDCQYVY